MLGTPAGVIENCRIEYNGGDGILLNGSNPQIRANHIQKNWQYGLECVASNPIVWCNHFYNDAFGEMGIFNGSHPVLWAANGSAGVNDFMNETVTLITMLDASPIVASGNNNFTVGNTGYFMSDLTRNPPNHDVTHNYWNPTPDPSKFNPPNRWTWEPRNLNPNTCGDGKSMMQGSSALLFEQGFNAEIANTPDDAKTAYANVVSLYPESELATAAATRLLILAQATNTSYANLKEYYDSVVADNTANTDLTAAAQELSTRCLVESEQFDPALDAYQEIMSNPGSTVDSVFAAVDYATTELRSQYESGSTDRGPDSFRPQTDLATVVSILRRMHEFLPQAPEAHHEGYTLLPTSVTLEQNYPNPFNALTTIKYYLPEAASPRLEVFNLVGQKVATLVNGHQSGGYHNVSWNAEQYPSGIYFYRLTVGSQIHSNKLLLLK
jgi:hypothetical protein